MLLTALPLDLWFVQLCRWRGSKIVLTVHDLIPHDTGEAHKQTFGDLYAMVDGIICHSDNIKTRLATEFSVPEDKNCGDPSWSILLRPAGKPAHMP